MSLSLTGHRSPAEIIRAITFECFTQKRIERFIHTCRCGRVRGNSKSSDVSELLPIVFRFGSHVKDRTVFEFFGDALEHRERFTKIHRDRNLREIFAHTVLDDIPQIHTEERENSCLENERWARGHLWLGRSGMRTRRFRRGTSDLGEVSIAEAVSLADAIFLFSCSFVGSNDESLSTTRYAQITYFSQSPKVDSLSDVPRSHSHRHRKNWRHHRPCSLMVSRWSIGVAED